VGVFAVISPVYALSSIVQNTAKCSDIFYLKTTYDGIFVLVLCGINLIGTQTMYVSLLRKKILNGEFDVQLLL